MTVRLLRLIVPSFVSTLREIAELHRIDLQHGNDIVEVHFLTGETTSRLPVSLRIISALAS